MSATQSRIRNIGLSCSVLALASLALLTAALSDEQVDHNLLVARIDNLRKKTNDRLEFYRELDLLRHAAEKAPNKFAFALITVYSTPQNRVDEENHSQMVCLSLLDELTAQGRELLRAELVKYLELDEKGELLRPDATGVLPAANMRKRRACAAYMLLTHLDQAHNAVNQDLEPAKPQTFLVDSAIDYRRHILPAYREPYPQALIEYLFAVYFTDAWKIFYSYEVLGLRKRTTNLTLEEFDLAHHIISTTSWRCQRGYKHLAELELASKHLSLLSNDSAWYSRRYVVHVLLKYPFFRTPELVKKLQNDPHPLVRERAKHIKLDPAQQK